jgi:phage tail-like protein
VPVKDANGSRFELLLGQADWGRCRLVDGDGVSRTLADGWADASARSRLPLAFDAEHQTLSLSPRISRFRAGPSDAPPDPARRLGAAADAFGSVYWITEAGARIDVQSSGSRGVSLYARAVSAAGVAAPPAGEFGPHAPPPPAPPRTFRGLAVTTDHYLVAGVRPDPGRGGGLRVFDLVAGGPPLEVTWPAAWPFDPHDLAPRPDGGLAVLDRQNRRVWLLDRRLGMRARFTVEADDPSGRDDFAPAGAPAPPSMSPAPPAPRPWFDLMVDVAGGGDPVAVEVLADGAVLVMDAAGADGFALLSLYVDGALAGRVSTREVLDVIDPDERAGFVLRGHDCALAPRPAGQPDRLVIASHEGNQCFAFDLLRASPPLALDPVESFLPMRRFGGLGLVRRVAAAEVPSVPQDTGLLYDGVGAWLPLVAQTRPRFAAWARLITPPLDGDEAGRTWHRLVIDGCLPPGSAVEVESRAADDLDGLADQPFRGEPAPILRSGGAELPWLLEGPGARAEGEGGVGSWELLFQRARGRWLQLRLTLRGDELTTPRLLALRAWGPRFSYASRYLPAVYREDETSADFLERFLANFEGLFTALEDRIAAASALFDVRTAPAATLDWLAGWLGLVLDPAVDEARKRLLIRFAIPLYQYRGTTQGVRLAAELVLSPRVRPRDLALPARSQDQPSGIRIVERYLTRRLPRAVLGETVTDAPRLVAPGRRWSPAEGAEGLQRRYREAQARAGVAEAASAVWRPVTPPAGAALWRAFAGDELGAAPQLAEALATRWRAYLQSLAPADRHGMGPDLPARWPGDPDQQARWRTFIAAGLGADLRRWLGRWQAFLGRRYLRVDDPAFVNAWGAGWPGFELVPAPDVLPTSAAALADWALFETRLEPMARTAHRFSVLLPSTGPLADAAALTRRMEWAERVVRLEKPAHTVFDVRPYWALFRVGQARLQLDTLLGRGSRAPELAPELIVGSGHVGAGRLALEGRPPRDRLRLAC